MDLDITTIIEKYGISGLIIFIVAFIIMTIIKTGWLSKAFGKLSDNFLEKFIKNKIKNSKNTIKAISDSNISNHDIFNIIDFWMISKIPTFQFSTEYRTVVFRKYLIIYLKTYKNNILKFVNSKEYQDLDESQFCKALLNLINETVNDYEKEMIDSNIPKVIIEKMKVKNNDSISLLIDIIESTCNNSFFNSENNLLKMYSFLNILLSILENTIYNSETICNSINGQLKGQVYIENGRKISEP